jgi:hypothetical protein
MALNNKNKIYLEAGLLIIFTLIALIFWESPIIYPVKLFVVMLHELSHALMAIATFGEVKSIKIFFDLGGVSEIEGGNELLVASSGYLGSFIFGSLIFYSGLNKKAARYILPSLSFILFISAIIFFDLIFSASAIVAAVTFIILGYFINSAAAEFILKYFGLLSLFYVLFDLRTDVFSNRTHISDATHLSIILDIPEYIIGIGWILIACAILFILLKLYAKKF